MRFFPFHTHFLYIVQEIIFRDLSIPCDRVSFTAIFRYGSYMFLAAVIRLFGKRSIFYFSKETERTHARVRKYSPLDLQVQKLVLLYLP